MIASFFAGVGGIDIAFKQAGFHTVYANEIDQYAATTFRLNFDIPVDVKDIRNVQVEDLPAFDVLVGGFPCQAFSIAGYQQGFDDEKGRGNLFFEIIRILEHRRAKVVFLENVKNLVSHDNGNTFITILNELEKLGYHIKHKVLNGMHDGNTPQNRERIYIVAFQNEKEYKSFEFPPPIKLTRTLSNVIDYDSQQEKKYYYTDNTCNFFTELQQSMIKHDTVYQWRRIYVRENQSNVCPTLTANMGTGGHNVPLIFTTDKKYRKLTPHECFRLQGFPEDFTLPTNIANTQLYKQAGNSVVVPVIRRIAENIASAMRI